MLIDMHCISATRGYPLQSEEEYWHNRSETALAPQLPHRNRKASRISAQGCAVNVDFGYNDTAPETQAPIHDYGFETQRTDADVADWPYRVHVQATSGRRPPFGYTATPICSAGCRKPSARRLRPGDRRRATRPGTLLRSASRRRRRPSSLSAPPGLKGREAWGSRSTRATRHLDRSPRASPSDDFTAALRRPGRGKAR